MSDQVAFDTLRRWGDTLERAIVSPQFAGGEVWTNLFQVFYPYAGIWHDHIVGRRDPYDMTRLSQEHIQWAKFAASHYSALVRVFQASRKYVELLNACEEAASGNERAAVLFQAHDGLVGLWENLGSAIDCLGRCFDDAPCLTFVPGDGLQMLQGRFAMLSTAYRRRTQMIHYSLVPIGFVDGMLIVNERVLDATETIWVQAKLSPETIDTYHETKWRQTVFELGSAWQMLRDALRRHDAAPPIAPRKLDEPESGVAEDQESGNPMPPTVQVNELGRVSGSSGELKYCERNLPRH